MLDFVGEQSKRLNRSLSAGDQQRMDQYFTSVRELEQRLHSAGGMGAQAQAGGHRQAAGGHRRRREFVQKTRLMFDVMKLALETDSTRLISLFIDTTVIHNITHHGNRPEVLAELRAKEEGQFDALAGFLHGAEPEARKKANRCSTARWCSTARAWAAPTRTRTSTCRCCWPAAASSTASTWRSTSRTTTRWRTCTFRCSSGWAIETDNSRPPREPCAGWRWREHKSAVAAHRVSTKAHDDSFTLAHSCEHGGGKHGHTRSDRCA